VLSRTRFLEDFEGDTEIYLEMLAEQTASQAVAIEEAINTQKTEELRFVAHSLNGASATVGADRVGAAAFRLEKIGINEEMGEAPAAFQVLRREIETLVEEIELWQSGVEAFTS
jgi:HPt (histidine-containing phosphotransfer) domain-containing protein